jgi:hypothetical protein
MCKPEGLAFVPPVAIMLQQVKLVGNKLPPILNIGKVFPGIVKHLFC